MTHRFDTELHVGSCVIRINASSPLLLMSRTSVILLNFSPVLLTLLCWKPVPLYAIEVDSKFISLIKVSK